MTGAMYAAIGGLKSHMSKLNVIGNNIANCNTYGYKAQRMTFRESMYSTLTAGSDGGALAGGVNPSQVGYGASVGCIDLNMSTSTFAASGIDLDAMIVGEGFFLVGDKDATSADQLSLTRVGDFGFDSQGYLVDGDGRVVFGFKTVQNPNYKPGATEDEQADNPTWNQPTIISTQLVPLRLPAAAAAPTVDNGGYGEIDDPDDIEGEEPLWREGDPVYDVLGAVDEKTNSRTNIEISAENSVGDNGAVQEPADPDEAQVSRLPVNKDDLRVGVQGISIDPATGMITARNNKTGGDVSIGCIAIATVDNPSGVTHEGGPYYKCMGGAGDIHLNAMGGALEGKYLNNQEPTENISPAYKDSIGTAGKTKLQTGGLEASSTDIATEFSEMITTQRGYQANTRIITVTDSMLEELVNMKR
ncbi:MAG: flagellar hook-basal body complex protein [Oscillospiraceae bacterium]|nr:flagellar hook-basal body complex protein [Oscillospiraceae bacterium]